MATIQMGAGAKKKAQVVEVTREAGKLVFHLAPEYQGTERGPNRVRIGLSLQDMTALGLRFADSPAPAPLPEAYPFPCEVCGAPDRTVDCGLGLCKPLESARAEGDSDPLAAAAASVADALATLVRLAR